jgi:tetratricopeptide (TPR) repeat protein
MRAIFCRKLRAAVLLILVSYAGHAQTADLSLLNKGKELFSQGKWREAVLELRRLQAEASSRELRGEAFFWISLSELSAGEYEEALRDMEALEETDPRSPRIRELPYHRGRIFFHLGYYDEAIILLKRYSDSFTPRPGSGLSSDDNLRKAAALYWTGECLLALGQIDKAFDVFKLITEEYPNSPKYEASSYRLALINQKKVEAELLGLLKWSHEEAIRNMEEFHRKESFYDQALSVYQKRIAELTEHPEGLLQNMETEIAQYRRQLDLAEERIRVLENSLRESSAADNLRALEQAERLKSMKESAMELESRLRGETQ